VIGTIPKLLLEEEDNDDNDDTELELLEETDEIELEELLDTEDTELAEETELLDDELIGSKVGIHRLGGIRYGFFLNIAEGRYT